MTINATLLYIIKDGKILLIYKKRGFGAGKWNGPGGKIEDGEDPMDAAVRETEEETGLMPKSVIGIGTIDFYMGQSEKPDFAVRIFNASDFSGSVRETEEAIPRWFDTAEIPYNQMLPDDEIWIPLMLRGKKFNGKFYFADHAGTVIINHEISMVE